MTKVKICGITNLRDALAAIDAGADLLGFIFYQPSPRYVSPEAVQEIVTRIRFQEAGEQGSREAGEQINKRLQRLHSTDDGRRTTPQFVGVFVNERLETVQHILDFCQLDAVQLHGEESPAFVEHFQGRAFKAMRPQSAEEANDFIKRYQTSFPCALAPPLPHSPASLLPCFLIDAYHPKLYGGTGRVSDWTMAANLARRYPLMLAGSLTPENVAEAIEAVRPWGVDVSSGVEAEKGRKDHKKVKAFVRNVKRRTSHSQTVAKKSTGFHR